MEKPRITVNGILLQERWQFLEAIKDYRLYDGTKKVITKEEYEAAMEYCWG